MDIHSERKINADLLRPVRQTSVRFVALVAFLGTIILIGFGSWAYQMWNGLAVAGIKWPVFWAFYITNFVFWIGISHAGTLISAILRLVNATWRRPVTRCAEVITVFSLMIGAMFPIIHLGRPWLFFWLIRDQMTGWRKKVYKVLALGWQGTTKQWHRLEAAMQVMAIAIVPVAISVHTIVSFDFSMSPVPMWHSTVFGPYFVAGAIFSGIAGLIIAMAVLRKVLHLEEYLHPVHFQNLGKLLLLMSLLWGYFTFVERLTTWYGNAPAEMAVFWETQTGSYAPLFWTMVFCNFVIPFPLLAIKKLRTITGCVIASSTIVVGMWLERFLIVVPSLATKHLPYTWSYYRPQPVEIMITISTFAAMVLLYTLFAKAVPIISIWELKVGGHGQPQLMPAQQEEEVRALWRVRP